MSIVNYNYQNPELLSGVECDYRREFICPEESSWFAHSLERMLFSRLREKNISPTIIEFGSGTGSPVVSAILNSGFTGIVYGYEINPEAVEIANQLIQENAQSRNYVISNQSFFAAKNIPSADYLIANPPYVPCKDKKLLTLPDLCGGDEGNELSKQLLDRDYQNVLLLTSSYSNPAALIKYATELGYKLIDFQITQMPFGIYSRQDIVQNKIKEMKADGKAFFSENCYLGGSVLMTKAKENEEFDLTNDFLNCITALR